MAVLKPGMDGEDGVLDVGLERLDKGAAAPVAMCPAE
jgi:hypothetical protein